MLLDLATALLALFGLTVIVIEGVLFRRFFHSFSLALEFWLAAGLLRLSHQTTWKQITVAATIVVLRKLVTTALARSRLSAAHS